MNKRKVAKLLAVLIICSFLIGAYYVLSKQNAPVNQVTEQNWTAEPLYTFEPLSGSAGYGYTPNQIKTAYNLPSSGGAGSTIAIIVAYDTPNLLSYLTTFSAEFGLPAPDSSNFEIHKMSDTISVDDTWSREACLDVEWAHAIAPQAKILLVEAVNPNPSGLFPAIDYATSQPDVVAVSLSWGGPENSDILTWDSHLNVPNIAFFAAAGNTASVIYWPATSPYAVAVGGTTLTLDSGGSVISENAWSQGGGGVSAYEGIPAYQSSYGLSGDKRSVPDVSYDADTSTGYPVYYNGAWYEAGGTSAGTPQWAAIYAIDHSATDVNLYNVARTAYASSFRDITSGSNGHSATSGYDYATGLGSPITVNFDFALAASPNQGPPDGAITLSGTSFTAGSSVNIDYLNPVTSSWVSVVNNLPIATSSFTYNTNVPDLQQNNNAGDHPALYDNIQYRATDNSNGHAVTMTTPYKEWRRGMTQIGTATSSGIFGQNTDLSSTVSVQSGQSLPLEGKWFSPGSVTLSWDGENVGTATVDASGTFTTAITVPATADGIHSVTVDDGTYILSFNLSTDSITLPSSLPEGSQVALFAAIFGAVALFALKSKRLTATTMR